METFRLNDLTVGYTLRGGRQKTIVSGIDTELRKGKLTCLIGENGVGKSTLLRTIAGSQPALSGEVLVDGRPIADYSRSQWATMVSLVLPQQPESDYITVDEVVGLGRSPYTGFWGRLSAADREVVAESLRLVGISHLSRRRLQTLSDGERQKTMIAKALAQQTPVVLLDEPTAFLDFPSKAELLLLLRQLAAEQHKCVLLSTHDLHMALQLADNLWLLSEGQMIEGTPRQLAQSTMLADFLHRPGIDFDPATLSINVRFE